MTTTPSAQGDRSAVLTPTRGVDCMDALATSMFAAPSVYAVLIGSGLSSAAGVPTGDAIVNDLIARVAHQRGVDERLLANDPQKWWLTTTQQEPRYDDLLTQLAPTYALRQAMLRPYFEHDPDTGQSLVPTHAHRELAQLCANGLVRVILTTNFDALIEEALANAAVPFQLLVGEGAINARIPLVHAPVTVIKLHGDYRSTDLKNTPSELAYYGEHQSKLLAQVWDDFGLLVVGWSATWDTALTKSIEETVSRRYPMYWVSHHGSMSATAQTMINNRGAHEIASAGADVFFGDLSQRLERLSAIAARRPEPVFREAMYNQPPYGPGNGRVEAPWLTLRVAAQLQPNDGARVGLIAPEEREQLLAALETAEFVVTLREWNTRTPLDSAPNEKYPAAAASAAMDSWRPSDGLQSTYQAVYVLGGDGRAGVSTVAELRTRAVVGGVTPVLLLDVGVSLADRLGLDEVARLLSDGLTFVSADGPNALTGQLFPLGATVSKLDAHLLAIPNDTSGATRSNTLLDRIDLTTLQRGTPTIETQGHTLWAFGIDDAGPLTTQRATELVVAGFNVMALNAGYLDPRSGIDQLRDVLGRL